MQQRGITQLHHLIAAENDLSESRLVGAIDGLCEAFAKIGDAERMPGRRRVTRLDGLHRRPDKTFE